MLVDERSDFPPEGLVLRGRPGKSVVLWTVCLLAVVVLLSDLAVGLQWIQRGQPRAPLFLFAAVVLALSTALLLGTVIVAVRAVRRQGCSLGDDGLRLPGRDGGDLLPWTEIRAITRRGVNGSAGGATGVAVLVTEPERFVRHSHTDEARTDEARTDEARADEHVRDHGTPVYLDLTDVAGGTARFIAAARWYADRAGRTDLVLD